MHCQNATDLHEANEATRQGPMARQADSRERNAEKTTLISSSATLGPVGASAL